MSANQQMKPNQETRPYRSLTQTRTTNPIGELESMDIELNKPTNKNHHKNNTTYPFAII